jgi:hypothetical protein
MSLYYAAVFLLSQTIVNSKLISSLDGEKVGAALRRVGIAKIFHLA